MRSEYEAFAQGFHRVCGGRVLELFQPQELMEMVVGSNDYDLNDLEKVRSRVMYRAAPAHE